MNRILIAILCISVPASGGCSVKKFAINKLGDSLASSSTTYTADDDPELVGQALPFGLKLIESLLAESPRHQGLLSAAATGFTSYAYAFVEQDADAFESVDFERAAVLRLRARRLYIRAKDYGMRGLETKHQGFGAALAHDPKRAILTTTKADVALLYWTAASWLAAISCALDTPELIAQQPLAEALLDRAYDLDRDFDAGALETLLISYETARQGAPGNPHIRARGHFLRARALTGGQLASVYVALAESVSVPTQNRPECESLLAQALAVDADARPEWRLKNLVAQRRARWLQSRLDDLFAK